MAVCVCVCVLMSKVKTCQLLSVCKQKQKKNAKINMCEQKKHKNAKISGFWERTAGFVNLVRNWGELEGLILWFKRELPWNLRMFQGIFII